MLLRSSPATSDLCPVTALGSGTWLTGGSQHDLKVAHKTGSRCRLGDKTRMDRDS